MDRHQVRYALLKICLVALVASTWVFWSFIFATKPEESEADALSSLMRLPASIPGQIPGMVARPKYYEPIAMELVKVPCWDETGSAQTQTSARWIRLTGKTCQGDVNADSISIRNLSNGFSATIFSTPAKSMTTDFIPLEVGKNEILIRLDQGQGASVEAQLSFIRE